MVVGIGGGLLLRLAEPSAEQIDLLGFAGELMLRLLKMLVLPLVAGSMVAGAFGGPPVTYVHPIWVLTRPHCAATL